MLEGNEKVNYPVPVRVKVKGGQYSGKTGVIQGWCSYNYAVVKLDGDDEAKELKPTTLIVVDELSQEIR